MGRWDPDRRVMDSLGIRGFDLVWQMRFVPQCPVGHGEVSFGLVRQLRRVTEWLVEISYGILGQLGSVTVR